MSMRNYILPVLVLLLTQFASAQSEPETQAAKTANIQPPAEASATYRDTIRLLKEWIDTNDNEQMAHLFAIGDLRASDLLTACGDKEDEIASVAFFTVQLLGIDGGTCFSSMRRRHKALVLSALPDVAKADFRAIDRWLSRRRSGNTYKCERGEEASSIDDALVYALVLDDSALSKSALKRLLSFEKACGGLETFLSKTLRDPETLAAIRKARAHDLSLEPDTLETSIRASAFFLPTEHRKDATIELLARNSKDDRVLLEVSYRCGMLCGRGYYVVLRKDGSVWQYAIIRMIWIS